MWSIHELKRKAISLHKVWRTNTNVNLEPFLQNFENLINDLREFNYNNQCKSQLTCKYWRADCCNYGNRCRFKHFKINNSPLVCPYGRKCRKMVNGKCNCAQNIRNQVNHPAVQPYSRVSNGNNKLISNNSKHSINNNQDYFSLQFITTENNGINKIATKNADITIPQSKSNKDKLTQSKRFVSNNVLCSSLHNNNNNKNNRKNSNNNNNNNNKGLVTKNDIMKDIRKRDTLPNSNFGISSVKGKDRIIGNNTMNPTLQLTKNESFDGSGAGLSNNNTNKNSNNIQSNKNKNISHIEIVKQKRSKVLAIHNKNLLKSSLHSKNNNNNTNNNRNSNNNNNNMDLMPLNGLLDDNFGFVSSSDGPSSEISNMKENDEKRDNCDTYRLINGNGINSPNLQLTTKDLGGGDADLSLLTDMVCNNKIDTVDGKQQLKSKDNFDKSKNTDSSASSIISTSSTDAILYDSEEDQVDVAGSDEF